MAELKSLTCPTCGAPLSISGNETEIKCPYCGNVVLVSPVRTAQPAPAPQVIVQPAYEPPPQPAPRVYTYRRSSCASSLVVMLVFGVIAGVTMLVSLNYGGNFGSFLNGLTGNGAKLLTTFGGKGTGAGYWNDAKHVAVDGKGYVYVDDNKTGRIQRFDANGRYVSYWDVATEYGIGPDCLAADRTGNVYVCEGGTLLKYDGATGELLGPLVGKGGMSLLGFKTAAVTLDGGLVAGDGDTVFKFDANGHVINTYNELLSTQLAGATFGNENVGAVDGLGKMYFLNPFNETVLLYSADGKFLNRFGSHGRGADQFDFPQSIAVDAQSRIYVGDRGNIKVFDNTGRYLVTYPVPGTIYTTYSLAFGDVGTLYALCMDNADNEQAQVFKLQLPNRNFGKS